MSTTVHRSEAVVEPDHGIRVTGLPLNPGQRVEVIVVPMENGSATRDAEIITRLRGSILKDENPFGPATAPEDWEAAR